MLWTHREALGRDGVGYPLSRPREHFAATMDLREATWGGRRDPAWDGTWDAIAARARAWTGPGVVLSNELLGVATPQQIRRALDSLAPAHVHVVFTARDVARQLPSDWQEQVKHTKSVSFDEFVDHLAGRETAAALAYYDTFWALHDPVRVLRPWADAVGRDRVHVVTVPPAGSDPAMLWTRFAGLLGVRPDEYPIALDRSNPSLGATEAELLRRVNASADRDPHRNYNKNLRSYLIVRVLAAHGRPAPIPLPDRHREWAIDRSREIITGLRDERYDIVGDLADLMPADPATDGARRPADVTERELLEAAVDALAGLATRPPPPATPDS